VKALSIRQPWAWLVIHGYKDVENRPTAWDYTGPLAVHASATPADKYEILRLRLQKIIQHPIPTWYDIEKGGFIGSVNVDGRIYVMDRKKPFDCYPSIWFSGPEGYVLSSPRKSGFVRWKGRLGLFDIPDDLLDFTFSAVRGSRRERRYV
jgi:hypothetical protein